MKLKVLALMLGMMLCGAMISPAVMAREVQGTNASGGASGGANQVKTVTCPAGSARQTAPTYADCNLPETLPTKDLPSMALTIINVIVSAVGIVAVAVIVIGGVFYVISTGEAAKTKRAQYTILYGVVGLVIAILAYAIVNFVLKSVFS